MRKATGSYRTYSIPGKTSALVPEFAVEDLPLGRTTAQVPELAVKDLPLGRTLMMMKLTNINFFFLFKISSRAICRVTLLKLVSLDNI